MAKVKSIDNADEGDTTFPHYEILRRKLPAADDETGFKSRYASYDKAISLYDDSHRETKIGENVIINSSCEMRKITPEEFQNIFDYKYTPGYVPEPIKTNFED